MDQSQNNHHFGAFNHTQFGVDTGAYGYGHAESNAFHDGSIDGVNPTFFGEDNHSALSDQDVNHFQPHSNYGNFVDLNTPYDQRTVQASQTGLYGQAQQSGVTHFSLGGTAPQAAQSNHQTASLGNAYHGYHAQSPALGHQVAEYQSLHDHEISPGYHAPQVQNGYQPQTGYVSNQAQTGQPSGSADSHQGAFQPYQHLSPSPSPSQPAQRPYGQQAGPSPVTQAAVKAPQQIGTPTVSRPQVAAQSQPQSTAAAQLGAQYQAQTSYHPTSTIHYQPSSQPQSATQSHLTRQVQAAAGSLPSHQPQAAPHPQPVGYSTRVPPVSAVAPVTTASAPSVEVSRVVQVPDYWVLSTANDIPAGETSTSSWDSKHGNFSLSTYSRTLAKQKYQQTVSLFARSDKKRLFPEYSFLLPSEALGKFMDNVEKLKDLTDVKKKDTRRKELYCTLRYDLKRGDHHMDPSDLGKVIDKECKHRKVEPADIGAKDKDDQPARILEDVRKSANPDVDIETAALLDIPGFWGADDTLVERMAEDLEDLIDKHVDILKAKAEYKELREGVKSNRTDPGSVSEQTMEKLRTVVQPLREKVGRILTVAATKADDRVLDKMERSTGSSLPQLLVPLWNLALICANTGDLNSPLVKAILDFTGRFPKLNDEALARIKFPQLAPKIEAQGADGVKPAIAKIRAIAAKNPSSKPSSATAAKTDTSKPTTKSPSTSSTAAAAAATKPTPKPASSKDMAADSEAKNSGASSKKRPLDEGGESSASKKPATTTTRNEQRPTQPPVRIVYDLKPASRRAPPVIGGNRRPTTKPAPDQSNAIAGSSTPAMTIEPPKSRNAVTGQSTTSSSEAIKASRGSAAIPAKAVPKAETAQPSPSSSSGFSALFAEINAPKEEVKAARAPAEIVPDLEETEQDRDRRSRKEKRRKLNLRVAFKADSQLTEVRIFEKEDGEDDGPEGNMTRDAADDKAEGIMLKASRRDQITLDREWEEPTQIDFSDIPDEQRAKSFITRGGTVTFETEEQKKMSKEEMTQLMVVYTNDGDIPPTPSSPVPVEPLSDSPQAPELPLPTSAKWRTRPAERLIFGPVEQLNKAWNQKLGLEAAPVIPPSLALSMIEKAEKVRAQYEHLDADARAEIVLQILNSERAKNWIDPDPYHPSAPKTAHRTDYPDAVVQAAEDVMEGVVRTYQGKPAIPDQPPSWMQNSHARVQEWWEGYSADQARRDHERQQQEAAARQQAEQHAALLAAQAAAVAQQNPYAAYYQNQAQNPFQAASVQQPPPPPPGFDPQVQALLAAMGQGQPQQQQAPDPNILFQLAQWSAASQGQQPPQQPPKQAAHNPYGNNYGQDGGYNQENHRDRDGGDRDRDGRRGRDRGGRDGRKEDIPEHLRGINRSLIGTKKCMFWAKGQCAKGDKCTFRHE